MFRLYDRILTKHPLATQMGTTGTLFALGDIISQTIIEANTSDTLNQNNPKKEYDPSRTARLFAFGTLVGGPAMVKWFKFLETRVRFTAVSKSSSSFLSPQSKQVFARVALDQFLFAPTFIATFFTATSLMEGQSLPTITKKLEQVYPTALKNNYILWPAVQLVNFYFTPLHYRTLVVNTIALGWNSYLAFENQRGNKIDQ